MKELKLVECPRDAMQGWKRMIPTQMKIGYMNQLLQVGFDTLDFGSFVSPKAVPQMADTQKVAEGLDCTNTKTKLLAIVANARGAADAAVFDKISCIGFPFSVSPSFQMRNTHSTISESFERVKEIKNICKQNNKELVIYISMAFGNPYGDPFNEDIVLDWINKIVGEGIAVISLADTVGLASPLQVSSLVKKTIAAFSQIETGVHLHSNNLNWQEKINAALQSGCLRFDGALKGFGGCPFAEDELVGNIDSELLIAYFQKSGLLKNINQEALKQAAGTATKIFI